MDFIVVPKKEKTVEEKLEEYVELQTRIKGLTLELDERKEELDNLIKEDSFIVEGVATFKRKASFVRQNFDKKTAQKYLTEEQFTECLKESAVKGSIEIMSWSNMIARKQMMEEKKK